jgi:hypothetical protein
MKPLLFLPLLFLLAGCDWLALGEAETNARLARLDAQIVVAIGEARADDVASCRAITYGEKACGGPSRARVYSEADGDPERVRRLAEEYTRVERDANVRFGRGSDCMYVMAPTPVLQGGRCVAGPPQQP